MGLGRDQLRLGVFVFAVLTFECRAVSLLGKWSSSYPSQCALPQPLIAWFLFVFAFETKSHSVALASLELSTETRLVLNSDILLPLPQSVLGLNACASIPG